MTPNVITTLLVACVPPFSGGAAQDLCALVDIKDELKLESRADDRWLKKQITLCSETIATYCNRMFAVQFYQDEIWPFRDSIPRKLASDLLPLQLARWPLANVPSPAGVAPPPAPSLSSGPGGTLAAARYYGRVTYMTAQGETAASLESNLAVAADQILSVAAPAQDPQNLATGWNCYLATGPNVETLQNPQPLPIGTSFDLSAAGIVTGAPLPNYLFVAERGISIKPLIEGTDFLSKSDVSELVRLHALRGTARSWPSCPILVQYSAGFDNIPGDVQDAAIQLVKARWFARDIDPMLKSENIEGVYTADRWYGTGPGGPGDLPNYVADKLQRYRVPVIA
ncbi:hypothetical protein [Methylovirgula sp. HY1]|uniref:hypothetical protein n=1 Tax=Methylovirgula sp. HY1 TaxID=2822761 RepID=UPI001C5B25E6|nr:hypothetical protein [Methylovirgula sp. HY1]QXX74244.1 hypothetical protein MHY1_01054 [Methylovirgula sp. HY1]